MDEDEIMIEDDAIALEDTKDSVVEDADVSNIIPFVIVSGKPPLLLIITEHPLLEASRLVLPKGSSHLEQTTEMLTFFKKSNINSLFLNPKLMIFLCLKNIFSLGSSPITYAFQSL